MRLSARILLSILFIILFTPVLVLGSLKFQILNYDFLTNSLNQNKAYDQIPGFVETALKEQETKAGLDKDEIEGYTKISKVITPELGKEFVKKNLKEILAYLNGKQEDVLLYIPTSKLEINMGPRGKIPSDTLPFSSLPGAKNSPQLKYANGFGNYVFYAWLGVLAILSLILFGQYKLGGKKKLKGVGVLFIVTGVIFSFFSLAAKFFLVQMARDLSKTTEPSQALIAIAASSFLPEIALTWLFISTGVFVTGMITLIIPSLRRK